MADPIAQFKPRVMLRAMRQFPLAPMFLSGMFVKGRYAYNKEILEINQLFGDEGIAAYTSRESDGTVIGKDSYKKLIHFSPYINMKLPYTPSDVEDAGPDNTIYDSNPYGLAEAVNNWLMSLERRLDRREEQMIAEGLQTGQVYVDGDEEKFTIDYDGPSTFVRTLTSTDRWSSTANKRENIEDWCQEVADESGTPPNVAIMDTKAWRLLKADEDFMAELDNRRIDPGMIAYQPLPNQQATRVGQYRGLAAQLDLYVYSGGYKPEGGSRVRFMQDNMFLLGNTSADVRFHFARIENFKTGNFVGERFPNFWESEDGRRRYLSIESSPVPGIHQINSFMAVTVDGDA